MTPDERRRAEEVMARKLCDKELMKKGAYERESKIIQTYWKNSARAALTALLTIADVQMKETHRD